MNEKKGPLVKGISQELQDAVLALLVFNHDLYDASKDVISSTFFTDDGYQLIYKALQRFHEHNQLNPTVKDIMIEISLLSIDGSEIEQSRSLLRDLDEEYKNDYINKEDTTKIEYIEEFVKRNGAEYCVSKVIDSINTKGTVNWGTFNSNIKKYTDFSIVQTVPYNTGNVDKFEEIRINSVGTDLASRKIRFFLDEVNDTLNHKALLPGTLTMVMAPPGTGKTLTLINQGAQATYDGFTNLHIFLGDLTSYDASLRYLAHYSRQKLGTIINMTLDEQKQLIRELASKPNAPISKNWVVPIVAGVITVNQLINEIEKMQVKNNVHFDQIIIDYDANIKPSYVDNLYTSGGDIYNRLRAFGIKNKSVILVASQPKVTFFSQEILTLDAAAESSMKQHICDLVLTLGKPGKLIVPIAMVFIPKNRNGLVNKKIPVLIDGATQTVVPITEDDYERRKREAMSEE